MVLLLLPLLNGCKQDDHSGDDYSDVADSTQKQTPSFGDEYWSNAPPDSLGLWPVTIYRINKLSDCNNYITINDEVVSGTHNKGRERANRIMAIDKKNGETLWFFKREFIEDFYCGKENIYLSSVEEGINAIDKETGEEVWTYKTEPSGRVYYKDDRVYFLGSNSLYSLNSKEKEVEWRSRLPSRSNVYETIGPMLHGDQIALIYDYKKRIEINLGDEPDNRPSKDEFIIHLYNRHRGTYLESIKIDGILEKEKTAIIDDYLYVIAKRERNVQEGFEKDDERYLFNISMSGNKFRWSKEISDEYIFLGDNNVALESDSTLKIIDHEDGSVNHSHKFGHESYEILSIEYPYIYVNEDANNVEYANISKYDLRDMSLISKKRTYKYKTGTKISISGDLIFMYDGSYGIRALRNRREGSPAK